MYKFEPLLKSTLWGGDKIIPFKHLKSDQQQVGESWEISGVKDNETIVSDGEYKGKSLNELVALLKEKLVGKDNYLRFGNEFPLLIKFIDARQDLSIQVHPTDEIAHRQGKERGKTEMWYIMNSAPDAKLYSGLKMQLTPDTYKQMARVMYSSCLPAASTPSALVVSWLRSSRPAMSPTASTTSSAKTKTDITASCTPKRPPSVSTTR